VREHGTVAATQYANDYPSNHCEGEQPGAKASRQRQYLVYGFAEDNAGNGLFPTINHCEGEQPGAKAPRQRQYLVYDFAEDNAGNGLLSEQ